MPSRFTYRPTVVPAFILFLTVTTTAISVAAVDMPTPPVKLIEGSEISLARYFRYDAIAMKGADTQEILGNYWQMYIKLPMDKGAVLRHYRNLVQQRQGRILKEDGSTGFYFTIPDPDGNIFGFVFCSTQVKHQLTLVRQAACPNNVQLGQGIFLLAENSPTPSHSIITDINGTELSSGDYNDFNKMSLQYQENGKSVSREVAGRYWQRYVAIVDNAERPRAHVSSREIRDSYLNAAIKAKAEILPRNDRGVTFCLDNPAGGNTYCYIWPQDGKYTMKIVDEAPMDQVLVFDSNEMMAQLDALGKITLEGIFFDTARATLKKESDTSLQAALELLTDYPDLVLEVAGHTDAVGSADANRKLSDGRANSVRQWLLDHGIAEARLVSQGYGEDQPVADNGTDEGRARNRRVELIKLSGGQVRDVISLIKPYPGSTLKTENEPVANGTMTIKMRSENGNLKDETITGTLVRKYFVINNAEGQRDKTISGLQILRNYRVAIEKFGGTVLAEQTHGLWFRLDNLDGTSTYAHVHAPGPLYNIETISTVRK